MSEHQKEIKSRKPGYCKDKIIIAEDFDELPEEIIQEFISEDFYTNREE